MSEKSNKQIAIETLRQIAVTKRNSSDPKLVKQAAIAAVSLLHHEFPGLYN